MRSTACAPSPVQDELARLLLQVAGEEQPVILLTLEEHADLAEADAEIARGEFATDEQMHSILAKRTVWLRVTRRAATQIEKALDYLGGGFAPRGEPYARERIQTLFQLLAHHPYAGQATDLPGVRRLALSPYPYLIFYRVTDSEVIVQRMRHTSRQPHPASGTP